jgi:thymidylate synthase (FAD)
VNERKPEYILPPFDYLDEKCRTDVSKVFGKSMLESWKTYNSLLDMGVKKEDARFVLPNACESKIIVTANARELRHFFRLRMDRRSQWEIRRLACRMYDLVMKVAPAFFDDMAELRRDCYKAKNSRKGVKGKR